MLSVDIDLHLSQQEDSNTWAVLVVTPMMRRCQQLEASREVIFIDSTSSCDATQSTLTVVLAATKAGAVPIAILIHKTQSTEGYLAAFGLLKDKYPLCFCGCSVSRIFLPCQLVHLFIFVFFCVLNRNFAQLRRVILLEDHSSERNMVQGELAHQFSVLRFLIEAFASYLNSRICWQLLPKSENFVDCRNNANCWEYKPGHI